MISGICNLRAPLAFVNQIIDVSGESRFRFYVVIHECAENGVLRVFRFVLKNPVRRMRSHDCDIHDLQEVENAILSSHARRTGRA